MRGRMSRDLDRINQWINIPCVRVLDVDGSAVRRVDHAEQQQRKAEQASDDGVE